MYKSLYRLCCVLGVAAFGIQLTGCAQRPESPKPYDLVLEEDSEYIRNASVNLPMEYWVVIRNSRGTTSMFPRPDGRVELALACEDTSAFAAELKQYRLCAPASSQADLQTVNGMPEATAMRVSTFLHKSLTFRRSGASIDPYPYLTDIVRLCERDNAARIGFLKVTCDRELEAVKRGSRNDLAYAWSEAELSQLPARLNAMYGIEK
jgi:hypothetical protein